MKKANLYVPDPVIRLEVMEHHKRSYRSLAISLCSLLVALLALGIRIAEVFT